MNNNKKGDNKAPSDNNAQKNQIDLENFDIDIDFDFHDSKDEKIIQNNDDIFQIDNTNNSTDQQEEFSEEGEYDFEENSEDENSEEEDSDEFELDDEQDSDALSYNNDNDDDVEEQASLTMEEELSQFKNLPIKMQSTHSFDDSFKTTSPNEYEQDDDYDFEEESNNNNSNTNNNDEFIKENSNNIDNDDYDFEEESNNNNSNTNNNDEFIKENSNNIDNDDYDFEEDFIEAPKQNQTQSSSKIARIIHKEANERPKLKTPHSSPKTTNKKKSMSQHIDIHKTKIILMIILGIIASIWLIASQIGITTHTIPKFKNIINIINVAKIQTQYTLRETSIFHKSEIELSLNDLQTLKIKGNAALSSEIFSIIQHNLHNATLSIIGSKISLINNDPSNNSTNLLNILSEFTSEKFTKSFKKISIENSYFTTYNSETKSNNNILIKNLTVEQIDGSTVINGTIATNSKPIDISYSYFPKNKKFNTSLKSSSFTASCSGTKEVFGTASKDAQLKGNCEIVIKNLSDFTKIFNIKNSIAESLKGLPQMTMQFVFEHSSLNDEIKISQGKINVFNSIGKFELITTPESYQGKITFDTISITDILSKIKEKLKNEPYPQNPTKKDAINQAKTYTKPNTKPTINKNHTLSIFSIISPNKPIQLDIISKNLTSKEKILFNQFQSNIIITQNQININDTKIENENSTIDITGQIAKLQNNPTSFFQLAIYHQNANQQANSSSNVVKQLIENASGMQLNKELTDEKTQIDISILYKDASRIINTTVEIPNILSLEVNSQITQDFVPNTPLQLQSIKISNTNIDNLTFSKILFPKGETFFGNIASGNETNTIKSINIVNSTYNDILINEANFLLETQKDYMLLDLNLKSDTFKLNHKTVANIENSSPKITSNTILDNIASFEFFNKILHSFFEKSSLTIPSFEKFDGNINFVLVNPTLFNKQFERIEIAGNLDQGILTLKETKISSMQSNATNEKPITGKMTGTIDLRRQIPAFNLELVTTNISIESFKSLLPFETNIRGYLYGGGSFEFIGTSYNEILSTLKTKSKFVIQEAIFSKLNFDFIGQHLTKVHKITSELDSDYIQKNFENNSNTKANIIFSLNGSERKFIVENCDIKTAYSSGSCYGSASIVGEGRANVEILAKFVVPALNINNSLKDVMKLYISTKIKTDGEKCEITNDFSQINQYTSYRKATFSL